MFESEVGNVTGCILTNKGPNTKLGSPERVFELISLEIQHVKALKACSRMREHFAFRPKIRSLLDRSPNDTAVNRQVVLVRKDTNLC